MRHPCRRSHPAADSALLVILLSGIGAVDLAGAHCSPEFEFAYRRDTQVGELNTALKVDVDHDGDQDIVFVETDCGARSCEGGRVGIFRRDASGVLGPMEYVFIPDPLFPSPGVGDGGRRGPAIGDFNGDGLLDAAAATINRHVVVLLGNGVGFGAGVANTLVNQSTEFMAAGDFDEDGKLDLVLPGRVWKGNGNGTFTAGATLPYPTRMAVGDLDEDGHLDLVLPAGGSNALAVLLGRGDGTFDAPASHATTDLPSRMWVGDLNGDGHLDVLAIPFYGYRIMVMTGDGSGGLTWTTDVPTRRSNVFTVSDVNGDGLKDLASVIWVESQYDQIDIAVGQSEGGWAPACTYMTVTPKPSRDVIVEDFTGDGRPDIALLGGFPWGSSLEVFHNITTPYPTSVEDDFPTAAMRIRVSPHPLRPGGEVSFTLPSAGRARLELFDLAGRRAATLFDGWAAAGRTTLRWKEAVSDRSLQSGAYVLRVTRGHDSARQKVVVLEN